MMDETERAILSRFFQTNVNEREQAQAGSGAEWLLDFVAKGEFSEAQRADVADWAEAQRLSLEEMAATELAKLAQFGAAMRNGNRVSAPAG